MSCAGCAAPASPACATRSRRPTRGELARFLPSWQNVDAHRRAGAGPDRLREALVSLQGVALTPKTWEPAAHFDLMAEMDHVFDLPYARSPHPAYADEKGSHDHATKIPAWEMIRYSVNIMRGCFGGCTFCSITEHEGRIIQSRSEPSILREIELIRDKTKGFTGTISDLGGPTANMYRLAARTRDRGILPPPVVRVSGHLPEPQYRSRPADQLYRQARAINGIKKILVGSGLRYDLRCVARVCEGTGTHHVGGYAQDRARASEEGPLDQDDEARHGLV